MKPLNFKEQNIEFGKNQPKYGIMPGHLIKDNEGRFIFCMGLSFTERVRVLFTGKIWGMFLTFMQPLTPSHFTTKKSDYKNVFSKLKITTDVQTKQTERKPEK